MTSGSKIKSSSGWVLCASSQLTGMRNSMNKWWTNVASWSADHIPLEFPWCIALVRFRSLFWSARKPDNVPDGYPLLTGLYDFYEDTENSVFVLNMPLGKKQASMILIMPYQLEPLDRLEKVLTRKQVDTWISKMENKAVAISMPKVSVDVSHNLQVNGGVSTRKL